LLKGVVVDVEAEEMEEEAVDSSVGVVEREVAIQQTAGSREMVAQRERRRCNNQPAQERRSARRETVAWQERGGVVWQGFAQAAQQKAMQHDSK